MFSPSFFVAFAFFLLICLIGKKGWFIVRKFLDDYSNKINTDINSSLSSYQEKKISLNLALKKKEEAIEKSELILKQAKEESTSLQERIILEFKNYKLFEKLSLEKRLERVMSDINSELREELVSLSILNVRQILLNKSQQKVNYQDQSLNQIKNLARNF